MVVALIWLCSVLWSPPAAAAAAPAPSWQEQLEAEVQAIASRFDGRVGVLTEDLSGSGAYHHRAEEKYYLASVIKMLVMIEFFHQLDAGQIHLGEEIALTREMARDGAGRTSFLPPGSKRTLAWLLEEMMLESDNAATDILMQRLGLERINRMKEELGLKGMGPIITMLDVRRQVYSRLDPRAMALNNLDYIALWRKKKVADKLPLFARRIGEPRKPFTPAQYDQAFAEFYRSGINSASLVDLASLLRRLHGGDVLSPDLSRRMMELMERCHTGAERVKAGLPPGWKYAHKTGTQHKAICDAGIATRPDGEKVVLAICLDGFGRRAEAEQTMAALAAAITRHLPNDPWGDYLRQQPEPLCREENLFLNTVYEGGATIPDSETSADVASPAPTATTPDAPSSSP